MDKDFAFHDVPASCFPFTIKLVNEENNEVWHEITVEGPGALHIPSGPERGIKSSRVEIHYPDGETAVSS